MGAQAGRDDSSRGQAEGPSDQTQLIIQFSLEKSNFMSVSPERQVFKCSIYQEKTVMSLKEK